METAATDIATIVAQNPVVVLIDAGKRDDLYAHIRREVEAFRPDLTTAGGRKAIKSLAFKITRTKTAIDDAGKKLNEEARAKIGIVDAARRDSKTRLEAMAAEVKKPLDEWEAAEAARVTRNEAAVQRIRDAAIVAADDTSATVEARGRDVFAIEFGEGWTDREAAEATAVKDATVTALLAARDRLAAHEEAERERLAQQEAERAELARLRAEAAVRAEREARAPAGQHRPSATVSPPPKAPRRIVSVVRLNKRRLPSAIAFRPPTMPKWLSSAGLQTQPRPRLTDWSAPAGPSSRKPSASPPRMQSARATAPTSPP